MSTSDSMLTFADACEVSAAETQACLIGPLRQERLQCGPVVTMPTDKLVSSGSPRLSGIDHEHARTLAESEVPFPPIIVSRTTLQVIDGMHRLTAMALRGGNEIEVQFFDGEERDAFVLAVEANIAHGLPLARADRTAAAARIIASHPEWSDRVIASKAGLAAKTVRGIRQRSTSENSQVSGRIGRDGRVRPLSTAQGRVIAAKLMKDRPGAPLREIAAAAGISIGTAQDVRERLRRGDDPVLPKQHSRERRRDQSKHADLAEPSGSRKNRRTSIQDRIRLLSNLRNDPSLRSADTGRILLRLLHALAVSPHQWEHLVNNLPMHCKPMVCDAAHACAHAWHEFATRLDEHR